MTLSLDRTPQFSQPIRSIPQWVSMTWDEYEQWRDGPTSKTAQWYFDRNLFLVRDMSWEGMSHAEVKDLFILLISLWYMAHPNQKARSFSGGLLERSGLQAASPDLLLYLGEGAPRWKSGETRRIDLEQWRVPNLVGEISDTTLASDLHEMKEIYAAIGVPEYWVIDIQGKRVLMFVLEGVRYRQVEVSMVMVGLTGVLLEEALGRWEQEEGIEIGNWFMQQISRSGEMR
jgi:Uma2 family endonuclease